VPAEARPICLSTVVLRDVILDFDSLILVIGWRRLFPRVPHFWRATALLFADGEEVSTAQLATIRHSTTLRHASSLVARDIRNMKQELFAHDPRIRITASGRGYSLVWVAAPTPEPGVAVA